MPMHNLLPCQEAKIIRSSKLIVQKTLEIAKPFCLPTHLNVVTYPYAFVHPFSDVSDDTLSMEDVMMQSPTPAHSAPHIKAPRKKHASIVPTTKWSKQKERDEFSSNEDLATNSEGKY